MTDSLGRTLHLARDAAGHVMDQALPGQQFTLTPDPNGNVTQIGSPQAGTYSESNAFTPVNLLSSYTLPAGQTTVAYDSDPTPRRGA